VMRILPSRYVLWVGGGQAGTSAPGVQAEFRVSGSLALPR
jgi:hypothetical protein